MLEGQMKPLDVARRILDLSTLQAAAVSPFTPRAWKILDRWAMNSPVQLKALEQQGEVILLGRLLDQQNLETRTLETHHDNQGEQLADFEILAMHQVETELM